MSSIVRRSLLLGACCAAIAAVGCGAEDAGTEADDLTAKTIAVGAEISFSTTTKSDTPIVLTVDCTPPSDPDSVGPVIAVTAPDLGLEDDEPARAGYWSWAGTLPAGKHTITLGNVGDQTAKCKVGAKKQTGIDSESCTAWTVHRSPNTHHTHIPVGKDASADWEAVPASGNHWGAWAAWSTIYDAPVKRGFLLHNLEHGGIVFSYRCKSAAGADCEKAAQELLDLAQTFGQSRVIITPDPTQTTLFAIRSWRWAYESDCLDTDSAISFLSKHYRHGREDIDADPPIPFDPTTTDVPCEDLMAAPDSCN
jgi:hypothetical protein